MKQIKLVDVAKEAGVSASTVSQYLSGRYNHMSKETKARIEEVIKALDYVPNSIARSLKTDKTNMIGVIVFSIDGFYTSKVVRAIDDYCKKHDYNMLIYNTDYDPEIEKKSINILKMLRVDGIIIASTGHNNAIIREEDLHGTPIVQMFMEYDDLEISTVVSDYRQGAYQGTAYLIEQGHKNIAVVTQEYQGIRSRYNRILGYEDALNQHGLPLEPSRIHTWDRKGDMDTVFEYLCSQSPMPTAIFSMNASSTTALMRFLKKKNLKVPEDLSIVGFDQLPEVDLMETPVTIVEQSTYQIGEKAAEMLLRKIRNKGNSTNEKIILPCQLVVRESCRKLSE